MRTNDFISPLPVGIVTVISKHGTCTVVSDDSVYYTPATDYYWMDTVYYTISQTTENILLSPPSISILPNLTVPQYPLSPATVIPGKDGIIGTSDDVCPYNCSGLLFFRADFAQTGVPVLLHLHHWQAI